METVKLFSRGCQTDGCCDVLRWRGKFENIRFYRFGLDLIFGQVLELRVFWKLTGNLETAQN